MIKIAQSGSHTRFQQDLVGTALAEGQTLGQLSEISGEKCKNLKQSAKLLDRTQTFGTDLKILDQNSRVGA